MLTRRDFLAAAAGAAATGLISPAFGAGWPERPVTILVPFSAGGNTDGIARMIAQKLSESLGQQFVVENRGGAGGALAAEQVARAQPDGYTMFVTAVSVLTIVPKMMKTKYDPIKDFTPISNIATNPFVLVVNKDFPAKTVQELVAYVKSRKDPISYASAGQGSLSHLAMALFLNQAGIDMVHVPFKGNAPATTAVLGNQVEILFGGLPPLLPHVAAGKLRALAISTAKRSPSAPDVPTIAESGYPGFDISLWLGFFAPKGTPAAIVKRLETELLQIANSAEMKDLLLKQGLEPQAASGADLAKLVKTEIETYKAVFKAANIKME